MNAPPQLRLNDLIDAVQKYHDKADIDLIKKAYVYCAKVHAGQVRKTGEPYLIHPLEVAEILAEMRLDEVSVSTGLLHDVVEDTLVELDTIRQYFGDEITQLVDGLTKMIIDPETERVLGVGIVGPGAGELIAEGVLAIEMGATASDVKLSIHPHPTLSETVMESAEVFFGQATHVYRPKRG